MYHSQPWCDRRTDLSAGRGPDELLVDLLSFPVQVVRRGGRPEVFTRQPELEVFIAELRLQVSLERRQTL